MRYTYLDMPENEQNTNQDQSGESLPGKIGRGLARSGARAAESIVGLPGNIIGAGVNALNYATGGRTPSVEELNAQPSLVNIPLPTSEQIKESVTKPLTGEYLEPQGDLESFADEVVSDAAPLFLTGLSGSLGLKGVGKQAAKSLAISGAGNTAKLAGELITGSPLVGAGAKLGTMLLAGTAGTRGSMEKLQNKSYNDAFSNIPLGKKFNFSPEKKSIDYAIKAISRSDIVNKADALDRLNAFRNIAGRSGLANVKEVVDMKRSWNEFLRLNGRKLGKDARKVIETARDHLKEGIARYGKTNNKFWNPYSAGEELTAGLRDIDEVSSFLSKYPYLKKKLESPILGSLFKGSAFHSGQIVQNYPGQVAAGVGSILGIQSGARAIKLMRNSPIAFKAYKDVVKKSLAGNVSNLGRDLDKIEKEYQKHSTEINGRYTYLDK
jgi:hypothetical protein